MKDRFEVGEENGIMKKVQFIGIGVLIIALIIMGVNLFVSPLSEWVVRIDGIIMLVGIVVVSYCTVKCRKVDL